MGHAEAELVVMVFRQQGEATSYADAVRTHGHGHLLAIFVQDLEVERLRVFATKLEDVADLDATREFERTGAVREGQDTRRAYPAPSRCYLSPTKSHPAVVEACLPRSFMRHPAASRDDAHEQPGSPSCAAVASRRFPQLDPAAPDAQPR